MSERGDGGRVLRPWPFSTRADAIGSRKASVLPEPGGDCIYQYGVVVVACHPLTTHHELLIESLLTARHMG